MPGRADKTTKSRVFPRWKRGSLDSPIFGDARILELVHGAPIATPITKSAEVRLILEIWHPESRGILLALGVLRLSEKVLSRGSGSARSTLRLELVNLCLVAGDEAECRD